MTSFSSLIIILAHLSFWTLLPAVEGSYVGRLTSNGDSDFFDNSTWARIPLAWYNTANDSTTLVENGLLLYRELTGSPAIAEEGPALQGVITNFTLTSEPQTAIAKDSATTWIPMFSCEQPRNTTRELLVKAEELGAKAILVHTDYTSAFTACAIVLEEPYPTIPIYTVWDNRGVFKPRLMDAKDAYYRTNLKALRTFDGKVLEESWPQISNALSDLNAAQPQPDLTDTDDLIRPTVHNINVTFRETPPPVVLARIFNRDAPTSTSTAGASSTSTTPRPTGGAPSGVKASLALACFIASVGGLGFLL